MITVMKEHAVGDIFTDDLNGQKVIVARDTEGTGCKCCAFASRNDGACPGTEYDRHPCCSSDRSDNSEVYYILIAYVPEKKAPAHRPISLFYHT